MDLFSSAFLLTLLFMSIPDADAAETCTFQRALFGGFFLKDKCGFQNSATDDFSWSLRNYDTPTDLTGPTRDHTGHPNGYYAYIESSYKRNGQFARMTKTFTKPAGVSGGCVQLYYHMYGSDIGTLNISVYDTSKSGPIANFQRTGEQGNRWLRADIDLNLPSNALSLQLILDGYVTGSYKEDVKGDIAVDDIAISTNGQCADVSETTPTTQPTSAAASTQPTTSNAASTGTTARVNWKCSFEGLNKKCGMTTLSGGASFSVASSSLRQSTGPQADHTTGSGHFLWMQSMGVLENSSAVVETPRFDQSYNCFTFWYHMYGSSVKQLRVEAELSGSTQYLWSQSGNHGNNWKKARVRISSGAIKLIITAVRGSTSDSDIAIDDLELSTTDCDGMTVPAVTTTIPTQPPTTGIQPLLQLACNFDSDSCSFYQDASDDFNWVRINGATFTSGTGPTNDHTHGDFSGYYMYLPSNYKVNGKKARIQSGLISVTPDQSACLRFSYHMYGADMGTLNIRLKSSSGAVLKSTSITGDQGNVWRQQSIDLAYTSTSVYLEFEGTIEHSGGPLSKVLGEMAIDDIILTKWSACSDLDMIRVISPVTAPTTTQSTVTPGSTAAPPSTPPPPTTSPWTTQTTTPSPVQTCNFDSGDICGFQQSRSDDFDWQRFNSKMTGADTGPRRDHTTGTFSGFFMVIDASYKRDKYRAVLTSPAYTTLSSTACLTFWYHMWGVDMGTLTVGLVKAGQTATLYSISGNQGNQWRQFSLPLDVSGSGTFQLSFTAIVTHSKSGLPEVLGDIAIDDVTVDRLGSSCSTNTPSTLPTTPSPSTTTQPTTTTTISNTAPAAGNVPVKNCTFSRSVGTFTIPDYLYCMFSQSLTDDFQWSLASSATSTAGTGPIADHTGVRNGYYAYIESSGKRSGQYARLSSPTFTKPAGVSGGCVQLYYHMYGSDIGTLNISVYDTSKSGPVAIFQRTGNQGNQWLRASVNLNLPAAPQLRLQLLIDAYVGGVSSGDKKGDIAIDDTLIYSSGQCGLPSDTAAPVVPTTPTLPALTSTTARSNWKCNFEGLDKICGMIRLGYGASFSVASRSMSQSTGPQADHTTGNGHFLWMQSLGVVENSSAVVETPRFDQSYNCFTFWYHMYGSSVRQLRVEADVNGLNQYLWSQSGNHGNNWKKAHVRISSGAIKLIITAVRGSTSDSDIAIDDLELSTTDCDGMTVPAVTTTIPTQPPTTGIQPPLHLACNFDSDSCSFYQDTSDDFNWVRINGATFTSGTGPTNDHTHGDFSGYYMYLPSNYKVNGKKARIQSGLISVTPDQSACLRFSYHMYGADMGTLNIRLKSSSGAVLMSTSITGNKGDAWQQKSMDLIYTSSPVYLEFEGTIEHSGGPLSRVLGEMAIDDIILTKSSACSHLDMIRVISPVTAPTTTQSSVTPGSTAAPPSTPPPPTTSPWTTQTTTPSPVQKCTFDNTYLCGYQQSTGNDFNWGRYNSRVTGADTGPSVDHTSGVSLGGYFMVIDASYKNNGTKAAFNSPTYNKLSDKGCLTFWYHMWGADMGYLSVSLSKLNLHQQVFMKSGDQGNQWKQFSTTLDLSGSSSTFQIIFTGVVVHNKPTLSEVLGDIAIDDVTVDRLNPCGSSSSPSLTMLPSMTEAPAATISATPATNSSISPISFVNVTTGYAGLVGQQIETQTNNTGVAVAVALSVIIIMVVAVLAGLFIMKRRQLWLFTPGSKLSVMFSKPTQETAEIYNGHNDLYSSEPALVIGSNGLHKRGEATDA